jgi:hypothetical protein
VFLDQLAGLSDRKRFAFAKLGLIFQRRCEPQPMFARAQAAGKLPDWPKLPDFCFPRKDFAWPSRANGCLLVAFGKRPHGARQRRTALCATMGNILKIAGFGIAVRAGWCDRGDCHAMSAARARK